MLFDREVRQGMCQRVDRPAVFQVTDNPDRQPVKTRRHPDRVQIEQRLCRVLSGAVAGVDQGTVDELADHRCRSFARVTNDQRVGVPGDHTRGVGQTLAFRDARAVDPAHVDDVAAEPLDRGREAHARPGARLEKRQPQQRAGPPVRVGRRVGGELGRAVQHRLDVAP